MNSTTYADTLRAQQVNASSVTANRVTTSTLVRMGEGAHVIQSVPAPSDLSSIDVTGNGMSGVIHAHYNPALTSEPVKMMLTLPVGARPESVILQANGQFPSGSPTFVPLSATIVGIDENMLEIRVDDTAGVSGITINYLAAEK